MQLQSGVYSVSIIVCIICSIYQRVHFGDKMIPEVSFWLRVNAISEII